MKKIILCGFSILAVLILTLTFTACGDAGDPTSPGGGGGSDKPFNVSDGAANIGRTGPGGGKIGYYSSGGFTVVGGGTCHFLEVSPENLIGGTGTQALMRNSTATSNVGYPSLSGTSTSMGSGKNNTTLIIAS